LSTLIAVVAGVLLVGGACATPPGVGGTAGPTPTGAGPGGPGAIPTVTQKPERTMTDKPGTPLPGATVTLRGTAGEGVEAGCVILNADDGRVYELVGGDQQVIMSGGRIEVQGVLQPDIMSYCQQGTLVSVQSVRRI
jgi:hypothetical protein